STPWYRTVVCGESITAFIGQQQYAIDLGNSRFLIADNRIDGVKNNSGIRITGGSSGRIQNNMVLHTGKSAIEVSAQTGALLIQDNLIANSKLSAIDAAELGGALIIDNRIHATPEYAISLRNERPAAGKLVITGNTLESIGKAMSRVQGMQDTILGDNHFKGT